MRRSCVLVLAALLAIASATAVAAQDEQLSPSDILGNLVKSLGEDAAKLAAGETPTILPMETIDFESLAPASMRAYMPDKETLRKYNDKKDEIKAEQQKIYDNLNCERDDGGICKALGIVSAASAIAGPIQGAIQGAVQAPIQGAIQGAIQATVQGPIQGTVQGQVQGVVQGTVQALVTAIAGYAFPVTYVQDFNTLANFVQNFNPANWVGGNIGRKLLQPADAEVDAGALAEALLAAQQQTAATSVLGVRAALASPLAVTFKGLLDNVVDMIDHQMPALAGKAAAAAPVTGAATTP